MQYSSLSLPFSSLDKSLDYCSNSLPKCIYTKVTLFTVVAASFTAGKNTPVNVNLHPRSCSSNKMPSSAPTSLGLDAFTLYTINEFCQIIWIQEW